MNPAGPSLIITGALIGMLGVAAALGYIPQLGSVLNSTSISNINVTCSNGLCSAKMYVINVNGSNPLTQYWKVYNIQNQNLQLGSQQLSIPQGQNQNVNVNIGNLPDGTYTFYTFIIDTNGGSVSLPVTKQFGTGSFTLLLLGDNEGTWSASPQGTAMTPDCYGGTCPAGSVEYRYGANTQVSISIKPTSTWVFQCFLAIGQVGTQHPCGQNPWTINMNQNWDVNAQVNYSASNYFLTIQPQGLAGGTVSPSTNQNVYPPSTTGAISATFSATAQKGYHLTYWNLIGSSSNKSLGYSNSTTITYSQLKGLNWNTGTFILQANFATQGGFIIASSPGITTVPTAGTYYYPQNQKISVSETTATGYIFGGWNFDGKLLSNVSKVFTFTMDNSMHYLSPISQQKLTQIGGNSTSNSTGGGGTCSFTSSTGGLSLIIQDGRTSKPISGATASIEGQTSTSSTSGAITFSNLLIPGYSAGTLGLGAKTSSVQTLVISAQNYTTKTLQETIYANQCQSLLVSLSSGSSIGLPPVSTILILVGVATAGAGAFISIRKEGEH